MPPPHPSLLSAFRKRHFYCAIHKRAAEAYPSFVDFAIDYECANTESWERFRNEPELLGSYLQ